MLLRVSGLSSDAGTVSYKKCVVILSVSCVLSLWSTYFDQSTRPEIELRFKQVQNSVREALLLLTYMARNLFYRCGPFFCCEPLARLYGAPTISDLMPRENHCSVLARDAPATRPCARRVRRSECLPQALLLRQGCAPYVPRSQQHFFPDPVHNPSFAKQPPIANPNN